MPSTRDRARANELEVLRAIGEAGWLSTGQVARWVWSASTLHVATNKAAAVLRRLTERGLLLRRESARGVHVFVLTKSGAIQANAESGPAYRAGYDLSQLDDYRQRTAVDHLIAMRVRGHTCTGAAGLRQAIATGALPDSDLRGADGLIQHGQTGVLMPFLVVRSLNPRVVKKAVRLKRAAGHIELLGHPGLVEQFKKEMTLASLP